MRRAKTKELFAMDTALLVQEILDFWFGSPDSAELGSRRQVWFDATDEFDQEIRRRFLEANRLAAKGALDDLKRTQMGNLALIILLDQFSRNIFRGAAEAFATDTKARQLAEHALEKRFEKNVLTVHGLFFYLPFEHAEDLESQAKSVNLFVNLGDAVSPRSCHLPSGSNRSVRPFPGQEYGAGATKYESRRGVSKESILLTFDS
jgi:uncharacterized protein (DUF924 family)